MTVVHCDQTKLSTWSPSAPVIKCGHVGWPGTATQPRDEAARPQGGQWHLQTCSWVSCRGHINVFSVLTLLQLKGFTLRGPPGQGHHFPALGPAWGGLCPESPQRVQPKHEKYQPQAVKKEIPIRCREAPSP